MLASLMFALALTTAGDPTEMPEQPIARHLGRTTGAAAEATPAWAAQGRRRDSLRNGARIGALLGAALVGGAVTYLCLATHEEGDPSCAGPILLWTAVGAGAGTLAGAGIDALFTRSVGVHARIRF